MSKIRLSSGFTPIPEGTHILKIVAVDYQEKFGKLEIQMETKDGLTHKERFSLLNDGGTVNDKALSAFSFFARTAMDDPSIADIDPKELVGHFIEADIEHDMRESTKNPGQLMTWAKIADKRPSKGWDEPLAAPMGIDSLKSLLG